MEVAENSIREVLFVLTTGKGGAMDGISGANAGASIDAVNQILMAATQESMQAVDKLMKVTVATAVGQEAGKGENFDVTA